MAKRKKRSARVKRQAKVVVQESVSSALMLEAESGPRALTVLDISKPLAGDVVRVQGGVITVDVVNNSANFTDVWAKVYADGDTPDVPSGSTGPAGAQNLTRVGASNVWSGSVTVAPADNALKVVAWARDPSNDTWSDPTTTFFDRAVFVTKRVHATSCLFFAWAPGAPTDPPGPWGEPIGGHRPESLDVPAGVNKVEITAAGSWRHDPADAAASGPEGRNAFDPVKAGYKAIAPGIVPLPDAASRLNLLVGMWIFKNGSVEEQAGRVIAIGTGVDISIPTASVVYLDSGVAKLYLGFHDGYQWNNNNGFVDAQVMFYTHR